MSVRSLTAPLVLAALLAIPPRPATHPISGERGRVAPLRVCADPNNLPFSNIRGQGFENHLAELIARQLGTQVQYTWHAQRRGFIRRTLDAGRCDVVLGYPAHVDRLLTTKPYYASTYVFVSRTARAPPVSSLDDPRLRRLKIGVPLIGDDYNSLPPVVALARRGIVQNVAGYTLYGDYTQDTPPADLIRAVEHGDVDLAIAWGPLAGYFARRSPTPLVLTPVSPAIVSPGIPLRYAIAVAVRPADTLLARRIDRVLRARHAEVRGLLRSYGVPLCHLDAPTEAACE